LKVAGRRSWWNGPGAAADRNELAAEGPLNLLIQKNLTAGKTISARKIGLISL
jgi:hypothetical protein